MWRIQPTKSRPMPRNISPNNLIGIDEENSWATQTSLAEQWWSLNVIECHWSIGFPGQWKKRSSEVSTDICVIPAMLLWSMNIYDLLWISMDIDGSLPGRLQGWHHRTSPFCGPAALHFTGKEDIQEKDPEAMFRLPWSMRLSTLGNTIPGISINSQQLTDMKGLLYIIPVIHS